ncbi:MAG: hypothetical protein ACFFE8_06460 [Candidatus Heimdallarchaeota archaeon]
MNLLHYIPALILSGLLVYEVVQIFFRSSYSFDFSIRGRGIVFIPKHNLWMAFYVSYSLDGIQLNELSQLQYLQKFSVELNSKKKVIRLMLYASSYRELIERIKSNSAILEAVLSGISPESEHDLVSDLKSRRICKIGGRYYLKEGGSFLIPQYESRNEKESYSPSTVLTYSMDPSQSSKTNQEDINNAQIYHLEKLPASSFFEYLGRIAFNPALYNTTSILSPSDLIKLRLRYFVDEGSKTSFEKGIEYIRTILIALSEPGHNFPPQKVDPTLDGVNTSEQESLGRLQVFEEDQNGLNRPIPNEINLVSTENFNQICAEMCNLPKSLEIPLNERIDKCHRRSRFCLKLVHSPNFLSILETITEERDESKQRYLLSELKRQLSLQQLICIFAQLTQLSSSRITSSQITSLILQLFKLQFNELENQNGTINANSELIFLKEIPRKEESSPFRVI